MSEEMITAEERRCLRMWFRQAIVQLEVEETRANVVSELKNEATGGTHSHNFIGRRSRRSRAIPHLRELVF